MNPKNERDAKTPTTSNEPRKRFRIEKLEERIAPKKGGKGTNNCSGGGGSVSGSSLSGSLF